MKQPTTWLPTQKDTDFSIHNLPFGIFSTKGKPPQIGIAIGDQILKVAGVAEKMNWTIERSVWQQSSLNEFMALGKRTTNAVRKDVQALLSDVDSWLRDYPQLFVPQQEAKMHLPVEIGDYTDFYASKEHATNVGKLFRDPENALLPNWKHLPVGYHGRASSIVVSGTPIRRPNGQLLVADSKTPTFEATRQLDVELEMAVIVGKENRLGQPVSIADAKDHLFGMVLFNDWSARDIQRWEYVPLGPFLGKSFASSMSPWVVTMEALEAVKIAGPTQLPEPLPYLQQSGKNNYDIQLAMELKPKAGAFQTISRSNTKYLYWSFAQQLTHHTSNGCNLRVGDVLASGTISGTTAKSYGSLLEMTVGGKRPIQLADGIERTFLEDGDEIKLRGHAQNGEIRVGFGEVSGVILSAATV
jgi:fumarylacetoacetase